MTDGMRPKKGDLFVRLTSADFELKIHAEKAKVLPHHTAALRLLQCLASDLLSPRSPLIISREAGTVAGMRIIVDPTLKPGEFRFVNPDGTPAARTSEGNPGNG